LRILNKAQVEKLNLDAVAVFFKQGHGPNQLVALQINTLKNLP